jgi:phosphatidylglycerophosphatase A
MRVHKLISTGLGTGYAPIAPGTVGALFGIIVFFIINSVLVYFNLSPSAILILDLVLIIFFTFLGVFSIKKVHQIWEHDANKIVIDEVVGVCIAALFIPLNWQYYFMAFVLFRFFDIVKPLGIKRLDQKITDWGVMLDDILAGVYALTVLQLYMLLF